MTLVIITPFDNCGKVVLTPQITAYNVRYTVTLTTLQKIYDVDIFLIVLQLKLQSTLFVCYICRYVIQHLFHNHIKVQLTKCMEFKVISALTNLGLLQANTTGWRNIFKAQDVVNGWYVGTCFVLMIFPLIVDLCLLCQHEKNPDQFSCDLYRSLFKCFLSQFEHGLVASSF